MRDLTDKRISFNIAAVSGAESPLVAIVACGYLLSSVSRRSEEDIDEGRKGSQNRMIWYEANDRTVCLFVWPEA